MSQQEKHHATASSLPRRRRYKLPAPERQDTLLPFVSYLPERSYPHYWQMPAPDDDFAANVAYGRECAGHLLQWLKDNQPYAGAACSAASPATSTLTTSMAVAIG